MKPEVYSPAEDTYLMLNQIKKYSRGNVLDMGTGSGILALNAAKKADFVYAADISQKAVNQAKKSAQTVKNIKIVKSDLFSYFKKNPVKFDLIIFNPPYLPEDRKEPESIKLATTGGKKGYELIERFLSDASSFLEPDGKILLLFSTLTNQNKIHELMNDYGFHFHKIAEQSFFYETIFVYVLEKSDFLIELESLGISKLKKFARGCRGIIYTGKINHMKIAVKTKNPESEAAGRIYNEARWLRLLNKYSIGPELLMHDRDFFIYKFVSGCFIQPYLENSKKADIKKIIKKIFQQCRKLDQLNINKEEMHRPYKHIVIKNTKPVFLDFERTHKTENPKNITQFCQYITSKKIKKILDSKGFSIDKKKIISLSKKYKNRMNNENFKNIIAEIK